MKMQLIRNATVKLQYGGHTLLFDPYLGEKGSGPSYAGKEKSPVVPLPIPVEEVLEGVEAILLSHVHSDHFDAAAQKLVSGTLPVICQTEDQQALGNKDFYNLFPVTHAIEWQGIHITRITGQHGSGEVLGDMGVSSGYLLETPGEPSLYWAGDTILTEHIERFIKKEQPRVILTHSCGAVWGDGELILMDDHQTVQVCRLAPESQIVAIHMEAVDHATVTREQLRKTAVEAGVPEEQLLMPGDGSRVFIESAGFSKGFTE